MRTAIGTLEKKNSGGNFTEITKITFTESKKWTHQLVMIYDIMKMIGSRK